MDGIEISAANLSNDSIIEVRIAYVVLMFLIVCNRTGWFLLMELVRSPYSIGFFSRYLFC